MINDSLVSIIMPVYKASEYLKETLDSIMGQSYTDWELIAVDDQSPDNSYSILKTYAEIDPRIRCYQNQSNMGSPLTRNQALKHAKGRYIAFCDADDLMTPDKLKKQIVFMQNNGYSFTYTYLRRITEDGSQLGHLIKPPMRMSYKSLLKNTAIATSTVILDRRVIEDKYIEMEAIHSHDYLCWLKITRDVCDAYCLPEDLLRYRVCQNSFSSNKKKSALGIYEVHKDILKLGQIRSLVCWSGYVINALKKYRKL